MFVFKIIISYWNGTGGWNFIENKDFGYPKDSISLLEYFDMSFRIHWQYENIINENKVNGLFQAKFWWSMGLVDHL